MEHFIIVLASMVGAGLTFFSGFGLGTLLLAVFVLFFPATTAVVLTAVVHFLNNVFKFALLGKHIQWSVVARFGLPAIAAAWGGARMLQWLDNLPPLLSYSLDGRVMTVMPVKLTIAILMAGFAVIEALPRTKLPTLNPRYLPLGGLLSGFFGGLSGHQGAVRSMFLVKAGLSKEAFIASGVAIAILIDTARLSTYFTEFRAIQFSENAVLLALATLAAFLGSFVGNRLLHQVTFKTIQSIVIVLLLVVSVGLGTGAL